MFACCANAPAEAPAEQVESFAIVAARPAFTENTKDVPESKEELALVETAPPTAETSLELQEDSTKELKEEATEVEVPKEERQVKEEPAAVEEKKVAGGGVVLEFNEGSAPVVITRRPVQLTFGFSETPVQVCKVAGHAEELGIQAGWTVKSLDGVPADAVFQAFYSTFVHRLNDLEGDYVLPLLFQKDNGEKKTYQVPSAPIGLVFNKTIPATIETSKGLAAQLGLQKGWRLLKYADKPVDAHADFDTFWADFLTFAAKLPKKN